MSVIGFPVLYMTDTERRVLASLGCPMTVPWSFVAEHREQCLRNHSQTPERLAERGGLAPSEMVAVVQDRAFVSMPVKDAVDTLRRLLAAWESARTLVGER